MKSNDFDGEIIHKGSFSWADLHQQDKWLAFSPSFGALTIVGTPAYLGRLKVIGRQIFFQVQFSAGTSIASVAGTDYLLLPITCNTQSLAGMATMTNNSTNVAVGVCHIDPATNGCYLPSQIASASVFTLAGWYER